MTLRRDGPVDRKVGVPNGFDYELHNRNDIEKLLGDKAWAISYKDSACRCFGYMVSALRGDYRVVKEEITALSKCLTRSLAPA